jgi:hypothetical protein
MLQPGQIVSRRVTARHRAGADAGRHCRSHLAVLPCAGLAPDSAHAYYGLMRLGCRQFCVPCDAAPISAVVPVSLTVARVYKHLK